MKRFLLCLTLFLGGCVPKETYTPCLTSINIIDREGLSETICNEDRLKRYENVDFMASQPYQKVLRVYNRGPDGSVIAYITSYHPNGQLKQYLEVKNGRALGTYREWYDNGVLKIQAHVIGGSPDVTPSATKSWLFDGITRAWNDNGNLAAEIPYVKGSLQGISIYYHPNGNIWKKIPYDKNEVNGTMEIFLEDGQLFQTVNYLIGQREGVSIRYWSPEKAASKERYIEGKLITGIYCDLNGNLVCNIDDGKGFRAIFGKDSVAELQEFRNGILEGQIKVFGKNNRIFRIYNVKNGIKHGEELEYYEYSINGNDPQPKLLVNWYDGKIQGIVKTWYDNGVQESQREMSKNMKNGLATAWYKDGNLMFIEEYDQNKLRRGEYFKRGDKMPLSVVVEGKGTATLFDSEGNFLRRLSYLNGTPSE